MGSAPPELRAVLDTNVLTSGTVSPTGAPAQVLEAWRHGVFTLVTSSALIAELVDVLHRPKLLDSYGLTTTDIDQLAAALAAFTVDPLPLDALPVHSRDSDDDHVLACALGGRADYIVSGDPHLTELDQHPALLPLRIVTPRAFIERLHHQT